MWLFNAGKPWFEIKLDFESAPDLTDAEMKRIGLVLSRILGGMGATSMKVKQGRAVNRYDLNRLLIKAYDNKVGIIVTRHQANDIKRKEHGWPYSAVAHQMEFHRLKFLVEVADTIDRITKENCVA